MDFPPEQVLLLRICYISKRQVALAGKGVRKEVPTLLQRALYHITMLRKSVCYGGPTAGEIQTTPVCRASACISHAKQETSKSCQVLRKNH